MIDTNAAPVQDTPNSDIISNDGAKPQAADTSPEEVESDEDSADSDGDDATAAAPKKNRGVGKRINELTREKYEAQRERERAREEAEYWRNQAIGKASPEAQAPTEGKPRLEDFNYDQEAYFEALADWKADQKITSWRQQEEQKTAQERTVKAVQTYQQRQADFMQANPDYMEVAINNPLTDRYSDAMVETIRDSDVGPQLAYYLGDNLDETAAILALPVHKQAYALGKIEARLEARPSAAPAVEQVPAKATTRAPAPPANLPTQGKAAPKGYHPGMSMTEYNAWRAAGGK